ncbi:hypothetical protein BsWGS_20310 [Bradybaena similaris]
MYTPENVTGLVYSACSSLVGIYDSVRVKLTETVIARAFIAGIITCLIVFNNIINLVILEKMTSINSRVKELTISMSASDLLLGIFVCIPGTTAALLPSWEFPSMFCQLTGVINGMSISVSMWSLTGISVERFLVIVQPAHFNHQPELRHVRMGVIFIWLFNTVYYVVPILVHPTMSYYVYQPDMLVCGFVWEPDWMLYLAAVLYPFGPGSVIVYCSWRIISKIHESNRRILGVTNTHSKTAMLLPEEPTLTTLISRDCTLGNNSASTPQSPSMEVKSKKSNSKRGTCKSNMSSLERTTMRREAKVSKVMIITAAAFFACSFPYVCTAVLEKHHVPICSWHSFAAMWILNCNSFINVFIYSATYREFRQLCNTQFLPACLQRKLESRHQQEHIK